MGMGGGAEEAAEEKEKAAIKAGEAYERNAEKGRQFAEEKGKIGRADLERYYGEQKGYIDPYLRAGGSALDAYMGGLGLNPNVDTASIYNKFTQTPAYQAALAEGQKSVERNNAARGRAQGGAAMKALSQYGSNYASKNYGDFMNRLGQMAGMGANMSQYAGSNAMRQGENLSNQGMDLSRIIAQLYGGSGENAANAELAAGAARAEAAGNKTNWFKPILSTAGAVVGGIYGGPAGAAAGGSAGSALGGIIGGG